MMSLRIRPTLSAVVLLGALIVAAEDAPAPVVILSPPTTTQPIRDWLRAGNWIEKRGSAKKFTVEADALHLVSDGDSVIIGTEEKFPLDPSKSSRLVYECRVTAAPTGTDLSDTDKDDCALRVYIAFDHGGGLIKPPDSIAYAWAETEAIDSIVPSGHFDNLKQIPIACGKDRFGVWITIERDVAADYARAFGVTIDKVPKITAIALKVDTNNTKGKAESFVRRIEFRMKPAAK